MRHKKNISGQTMVEFAFVAPLFFLLVLGGSEVGWLMFQKRVLDYAARQGALFATMDPSANQLVASVSTDISSTAKQVIKDTVQMYGGQTILDSQISLDPGNPWPAPNTFMLVVTESYNPIFGDLIPGISQMTALNSRVLMYCEACE